MVVLPEIIDERGRLIFAEVNRHIPFEVRRIFSIYEVVLGQKRAGHAHRTNHQFITTLSGTIVFDDGKEAQTERLASPRQGLYVPLLIWITLMDFTSRAIDERGRLIFAEVNRHIPFEVRRIFSIYEVVPGQKRAGHAHRTKSSVHHDAFGYDRL
jgi:hypothetical protein